MNEPNLYRASIVLIHAYIMQAEERVGLILSKPSVYIKEPYMALRAFEKI